MSRSGVAGDIFIRVFLEPSVAMPKAKRARVVPLTQVKKKGKEHKEAIVEQIRKALNSYRYCHVIQVGHVTSRAFQDVREALKPGRLFAPKNRLMQVALGVSEDTSFKEGVYKLSGLLNGSKALLMTNSLAELVQDVLNSHKEPQFAVAGELATDTINLESGEESLKDLPHSLEPYLRQLGLPCQLSESKIVLKGNFTVCEKGVPLTPNGAKILKQLNIKMGDLEMRVIASYDAEDGQLLIHESAFDN